MSPGNVTINLRDFARAKDISKRFPNADTTLSVTITYEEIAGFVAEGELEQKLHDEEGEETDEEIKNTRKRRRETSSEEELLSADEREWRRREGRIADRAEEGDVDFVG